MDVLDHQFLSWRSDWNCSGDYNEMTFPMCYGIATCEQPRWRECIEMWHATAWPNRYPEHIVKHRDILEAYQFIYENTTEPILAHLHDDLIIHEGKWDLRVLEEFADPSVGVVGFAGAPGHGHPNMYKQPYELSSLGRVGFKSNMRNAEQHGARFTESCDVAVLDGMALFVRRELLDKCGGWPLGTPISYFCYDYWLCCNARRNNYRVRLVGVDCEHLGGKSTGLNPNLRADFEASHRYMYDNFKDVLPARVG